MNGEVVAIVALRGLTVAAGLVFLAFIAQAYRRHGSRSMLWLGAAIGLMVVAALGEAVAYFVFGAGLGAAEIIEAAITLSAFLVLLASVRAHRA